jgi:hypothetical protein
VVFRRQLYGGRCLVAIVAERFPVVATLTPRTMEPAAEQPGRTGEQIPVSASLDASLIRTKVLQKVAEEIRGVRLESARMVVSGGRGLKGPEPFKLLSELYSERWQAWGFFLLLPGVVLVPAALLFQSVVALRASLILLAGGGLLFEGNMLRVYSHLRCKYENRGLVVAADEGRRDIEIP